MVWGWRGTTFWTSTSIHTCIYHYHKRVCAPGHSINSPAPYHESADTNPTKILLQNRSKYHPINYFSFWNQGNFFFAKSTVPDELSSCKLRWYMSYNMLARADNRMEKNLTSSSTGILQSKISSRAMSCFLRFGYGTTWLFIIGNITSESTSNFFQLIRSPFAPTNVRLPSSAETRSLRCSGMKGMRGKEEFSHASR